MKPNTVIPLNWSAYKVANPNTRIRNAAAELGISELELLCSDLDENCIRLRPEIIDILQVLPSLGTVMALTQNDAVVHEVTQPFSEMHQRKKTALYLRPGQDTRYFTANWMHVFAVNENNRSIIYQALGEEYATPLPYNTIELMLGVLAERELMTMIFVHNNDAAQSYSGPIKRLLRTGSWLNVLEPDFNLHLNTEQIGQVWLIVKPSENGWIHTLNVLDHNHNEVMIMTDNRHRGEEESFEWLTTIKSVL